MEQQNQKPRRRMGLSAWIILGLVLGICCGLFFGELCRTLEPIGRAYLMLLRMSVLPYIVVSLIHGIGSLTFHEIKVVAWRGLILLLSFWAITVTVLFVLSYSFPFIETASFYSSSMGIAPEKIDYLKTYIPDNPFYAMSQNLVPAVVVFSICFGVALIGIKGKEQFLSTFGVVCQTLTKITGGIVRLSPIGVFALTANAAGTISFEELSSLQLYFVCFIVGILLLSFVTFPALLRSLTPIGYREFFRNFRAPCLLAFTTVSIFAVLPSIIESSKRLLHNHRKKDQEIDYLVDVWVPISFNFPSSAMLFPLLFILFVAWFYDNPLGVWEHINLAVSGILSLFGSPMNAIPFLLDQMRLPADAFNLYVITTVVTQRFQVLLAAIGLAVFSLIGTCFVAWMSKIRIRRLIMTLVITGVILVGSSLGIKYVFSKVIDRVLIEQQILMNMTITDPVLAKVYRSQEDVPPRDPNEPGVWQRVTSGGVLRVGYNANGMPFAYFNRKGELVGYDIAFAHQLARSLGCTLEFVPFDYNNIIEDLIADKFDIAMSSVSITDKRLEVVSFTDPYMDLRMAVVCPDYRRQEFYRTEDITKMKDLKIAVLHGSAYMDLIRKYFPSAKIVELDNVEQFFHNKNLADVLWTSAEQGTSWTLLYPSYAVTVPQPHVYDDYLGYPLNAKDEKMIDYLNQWLKIQQLHHFTEQQYDYWILGKTEKKEQPRWSIIHNVLHWVN